MCDEFETIAGLDISQESKNVVEGLEQEIMALELKLTKKKLKLAEFLLNSAIIELKRTKREKKDLALNAQADKELLVIANEEIRGLKAELKEVKRDKKLQEAIDVIDGESKDSDLSSVAKEVTEEEVNNALLVIGGDQTQEEAPEELVVAAEASSDEQDLRKAYTAVGDLTEKTEKDNGNEDGEIPEVNLQATPVTSVKKPLEDN